MISCKHCICGKRIKKSRYILRCDIERVVFRIQQKSQHKIIKIIWENIYPINQYKEKVQARKNARIKIGNLTYFGDVEIDSFHSDWKSHGHNINKKYNKVILHAVLENGSNQTFVFTQEGRKVQSICLSKFLSSDLQSNIQQAILSERDNRTTKLRCDEINNLLSSQEKLDILYELGVARFRLNVPGYLND